MSDPREPPPPPDLGDPDLRDLDDAGVEGDHAGDPEPLHITELTPPPPPPPLSDEAPFVDPPIDPPSDPPIDPPIDQAGDAVPPLPGPVASVPTGPGPDPVVGPPPSDVSRDGWPSAAKVAVAVLAVLALAGIIGAVVGFARASSAEDDASASSQDVAAAVARAEEAEAELVAAQAESTEESARLASERDAAVARAEEAEAGLEALEQTIAGQEGEAEQLAADLAASEQAVAELEARVGEFDELFPVTITTDLASLDLTGPYDVTLVEVSCVGLELCGSPPQLGASTLSAPDGSLRLEVPGQLNVPLVAVGGSLFGVAANQALVPPCGDVPRDPALTMGLFADAGTIDDEGELTLTSLAGSVLVDVPAVGDCPVGRVWYRAQLDSAG